MKDIYKMIKKIIFLFVIFQITLTGCANLDKDIDITKAHYEKGEKFLVEDKLDEAESEFKKAIAIKSDHARPHYGLGRVYAKRAHLDEAIKEFEQAQAIFPFSSELLYELAEAYRKKGRLDEAIEKNKRAIFEIKDENLKLKIYASLGKCYFEKKEYELSIVYFRKVLKIDPLYSPSYYYLAKVALVKQNVDYSLSEFEKAVNLFYLLDEKENKKYFAEVYKDYSELLKKNGHSSKAAEMEKKYFELTKKK